MKIKFLKSNIEIETDKKRTPLIRLCYEYDTPINFGCRIGTCGVCKITIKKGLKNINKKNEEEEELTEHQNERLACQCIVKGDIEIE